MTPYMNYNKLNLNWTFPVLLIRVASAHICSPPWTPCIQMFLTNIVYIYIILYSWIQMMTSQSHLCRRKVSSLICFSTPTMETCLVKQSKTNNNFNRTVVSLSTKGQENLWGFWKKFQVFLNTFLTLYSLFHIWLDMNKS